MRDTVLGAVETGWDLDPALKGADRVGRMRCVSIKAEGKPGPGVWRDAEEFPREIRVQRECV